MPLTAMLSVILVYEGAYFMYNMATEDKKSTSSNAQQEFVPVLRGNSEVLDLLRSNISISNTSFSRKVLKSNFVSALFLKIKF